MTRREALEILGLTQEVSAWQLKKQYRTLLKLLPEDKVRMIDSINMKMDQLLYP